MRRGASKGNPFQAACHVGGATFVIGAESGGNVINVGIQLTDANARDLGVKGAVQAYWSDDADGNTPSASPPTTTAIGTDGVCLPLLADKHFQLVSEDDGDIDLNVTYAGGAATWYLNLLMPDGSIKTTTAITFA